MDIHEHDCSFDIVNGNFHHEPFSSLLFCSHNHINHSFPFMQLINRNSFYVLSCILHIYCSQSAVEYSKEFVTSIVVGKDVVPRIGLHQMETLRHDLMNALQKSKEPKVIGIKFSNKYLCTFYGYYVKNI